jgi:hypothetical protein
MSSVFCPFPGKHYDGFHDRHASAKRETFPLSAHAGRYNAIAEVHNSLSRSMPS